MASELQYEIQMRPDFSMLKVHLEQGQKIFAEPSAMASMSPSLTMKAGMKGGALKSLGRLMGGESMIVNTFTAANGPGEVVFAPGHLGDTQHYRLTGGSLMLQRGAYMANSDGVEVTGKWQGAKGFFSGEGLVLLKASGTGDVFFNSYGAILEIDVVGDHIVDTGYIVAFEDTLQYKVTTLPGLRGGGFKRLFFSGEGLVCRFSGQGKVWVQTRFVSPYLSWIHQFRPSKK
ncbi:MAG: TIGR00266 family protein [Planctomycetaceae bacterium]